MSTRKNEKVIEKNCDNKNHEEKDRRYFGIPYPAIYLKVIRLSCPFCKRPGRSKTFKNLWQLRMHFANDHSNLQEIQQCRNLIGVLTDHIRLHNELTESGVLR